MDTAQFAAVERKAAKRALIFRDAVTFFLLATISLALYGVTFLLFRSFESHRDDLSKRWAGRGQAQLREHRPEEAVTSLRAALSYAPDDYASQLLLAQALADAGETEQANNYFLNLWAARPGDGFLNLQLARLARRDGKRQEATQYYRASIFGAWDGDGLGRRRDVRLELVDYLIEQRNYAAARAEVLVAAGNAPMDAAADALFGDKLRAARDPADALNFYRKAMAGDPRNAHPVEAAGRLEFARAHYVQAHELLAEALQMQGEAAPEDLEAMAHDAERLGQLSLGRELPARVRARHLLEAAQIADARLTRCAAGALTNADLQALKARWATAAAGSRRNALVVNADGQDELAQLIFDTETTAETTCGAGTPDDALLIRLAADEGGTE